MEELKKITTQLGIPGGAPEAHPAPRPAPTPPAVCQGFPGQGAIPGKALEISSSAIRGTWPSKKTSHGWGGPLGGQLNSTAQQELAPGLPN